MTIEKNRRFTYLALLSAVAIALNLLESIYIGPIFGVLRLGLANIAALLALKLMGRKEMIIVNVMRVVIGNLLRGTIFSSTFWISSGGVCSSSSFARTTFTLYPFASPHCWIIVFQLCE